MMPSKKVWGILIVTVSLVIFVILIFGKEKVGRTISFATTLTPGEKLKLPENPGWQAEINKSIDIKTATTSDNKTDAVSTTLIYNYLALKQNNSLDESSATELVNKIEKLTLENSYKEFNLNDLNIIANNNDQAITDYGEELGNILRNTDPGKFINELSTLDRALNMQDPKILDELIVVAENYNQIGSKIKSIKTPQILQKNQLDMVNGIFGLLFGLGDIRQVFNDPIKGLQGVNTYQNNGFKFIQAKQDLIDALKKRGIIYKQGTGGYYLLYGI